MNLRRDLDFFISTSSWCYIQFPCRVMVNGNSPLHLSILNAPPGYPLLSALIWSFLVSYKNTWLSGRSNTLFWWSTMIWTVPQRSAGNIREQILPNIRLVFMAQFLGLLWRTPNLFIESILPLPVPEDSLGLQSKVALPPPSNEISIVPSDTRYGMWLP